MNCDNRILKKKAKRRGSGKVYMKVVEFVSWWQIVNGLKPSPKSRMCGGNIIADVNLQWNHCDDADIEIDYKCDRCGGTFFKELPDRWSLGEFITEALKRMTDKERLKMRKRILKQYKSDTIRGR